MKNAVFFVVSFALFVGGILLFALAWSTPGWEILIALGGVSSIALAFIIPVHISPPLMDP